MFSPTSARAVGGIAVLLTLLLCPKIASAALLNRQAPELDGLRMAPKSIADWSTLSSVPADTPLQYDLYLRSPREAELHAKMLQIAYSQGQWLDDDGLREYVAPSEATKALIMQTLLDGGAESVDFSGLGNIVTVRSSVGQTAKLFRADFQRFTRNDGIGAGVDIIRTRQYTIPAKLRPYVISVSPFADFAPPPKVPSRRKGGLPVALRDEAAPLDLTTNDTSICDRQGFITVGCLRKVLEVDPSDVPSSGPAMAVVGVSPGGILDADFEQFVKQVRPDLPGYTYSFPFLPNNPGVKGNITYDTDELTGDIQMATMLIPPLPLEAHIVAGPQDQFTNFFEIYFKRLLAVPKEKRPGVVSISLFDFEDQYEPSQLEAVCNMAMQITAQGTTIVVAPGDGGLTSYQYDPTTIDCPPFIPSWPSTCPYVLSVGATMHAVDEVAVDKAEARYWSAAGFSANFKIPEWQRKAVAGYLAQIGTSEAGNFNASGRAYPDISALGSNLPYVLEGVLGTFDGTSASAPLSASLLAIINARLHAKGRGTVGWVHPVLYQHADKIHDIVVGKTGGCVDHKGKGREHFLPVKPGWDVVTGLGSPRLSALRAIWDV